MRLVRPFRALKVAVDDVESWTVSTLAARDLQTTWAFHKVSKSSSKSRMGCLAAQSDFTLPCGPHCLPFFFCIGSLEVCKAPCVEVIACLRMRYVSQYIAP
jgi:hypothetical protein